MRTFAKCVLGFTLAMTAAAVSAQDYPTRPIKMVIPYGPGGGTDLVARKVAEHMRATLGQPVVVENVAGAGGNIGAAQVARAPGDGYTIMVTAAGLAIAPAVGTKLSFDVARDLAPIAQLATVPLLVLVRPDSPMNSIADLLAQAKKQAGKFSFASFGVGTPPHLVGESMKLLGKIEMTHVPYKGSAAAMPDTLSGRVDVAILDAVSTAPYVLDGRLKALAITGARRSPALPNVPTLSQSGIPFDTVGWYGMFGPATMPAALVERLNAAAVKALADPEISSFIVKGGSLPVDPPLTAAQWATQFQADIRSWQDVVTKSGAKFD
ncbi:MAG: tripartite tricarboxylate transporter substrate binding protein [Betaproteobacteria bacterium]|nr:tripartite tricarboxylate transporter substrate binding protein [Betaproteobacteria bacterium]